MLEGPSFLVSRELPSSCEHESQWIYTTFRVMELSNGKRRLEDLAEISTRKSSKILDIIAREDTMFGLNDLSLSIIGQSDGQNPGNDQSDGQNPGNDQSDGQNPGNDQSDGQNPGNDQSDGQNPGNDQSDGQNPGNDQSDGQNPGNDQSDPSSLIHHIGRDNSINTLLRCSRSDYGSLASLNRNFRSLISGGELYRLRRQLGIVEHWVYFSCNLLEWEAFDPIRLKWMHLPRMTSNECFMCSDKESLAVGTELLVFGKEIMSHVIYKYSILTNSWSLGTEMNSPRCLFGSASLGEIAIIAGGCGPDGSILSSAELYNSDHGTWVPLPSMHKPRKMCSGVFMDGKFYLIGGIGVGNSNLLTCGEVYDLGTRTWTEIPNMFPAQEGDGGAVAPPPTAKAPPLLGVVKNELYAAYYAEKEVRKYDKARNVWITVGSLPDRAMSMNGWGLAFRACGDRLIVIGGPRALGGGVIEVNAWAPDQGSPEWHLLASKNSASFVYNCAVMGC